MIIPEIPANEEERIADLESYSILDSLPEEAYDELTQLAATICNSSISLVTLIDRERQWFKSHYGTNFTETPREFSFCAHAINDANNIMIVPDSRLDERFHDNPVVIGDPFIVFYAGVPLVSPRGYAWGTLCVLDSNTKELTEEQLISLRAIANQVVRLFELRKSELSLMKIKAELEARNNELDNFASIAAHDIVSPLSSITNLSELLLLQYSNKLGKKGTGIVDMIKTSAYDLAKLIQGILSYTRSASVLKTTKDKIEIRTFLQDTCNMFNSVENCNFTFDTDTNFLNVNKLALKQIFINLISNAIKHNNKKAIEINIGFNENDKYYLFYIQDNGIGIEVKNIERIFELFEMIKDNSRNNKDGSGIGLATVKKLVIALGGTITVESEPGKGSKFNFSIAK